MLVRPFIYTLFILLTYHMSDTVELASEVISVPQTDVNNHSTQTSIPDEDPLEEAVTDPNVLAEVKLPARPSRFSYLFGLTYTHLLTKNRIQMVWRKSCREA